ncbi:MAG: arsenite methyltransferase, partial [Gemmatimonadaceae bacterium]
DAGFRRVEIEPTRVYKAEDAAAFLAGSGLDPDAFAAQIEGKFMSAFVRATKPNRTIAVKAAACCGPDCCN